MLNLLSTLIEIYGLKLIILGYFTILFGLPQAFIVLPILLKNRTPLIIPLARGVAYSLFLVGHSFLSGGFIPSSPGIVTNSLEKTARCIMGMGETLQYCFMVGCTC